MNVTPAGVEAIANYGILTLTGQDAGPSALSWPRRWREAATGLRLPNLSRSAPAR